MSEWTKEERERAIEQLRENTLVADIRLGPMIYLASAIDLQCSLNRLQGKFAEAREMLRNIENRLDPEWPISQDIVAWLSRNK